MKKIIALPAMLTLAALLGACSSMPRTTSSLEQTRSAYQAAQNNPDVARYASVEMQSATTAMDQANMASKHDDSAEKIDQLAYIAKDKIALAEEVTKKNLAQVDAAKTAKERDQMVLNQRTNEADQAKANAAQSQMAAADAQRQTLAAQAQSAQLQAQLAALSAKQTDRGMVITMGDVLFGTDMSSLTTSGMQSAQKLAEVLKQNPKRNVLIEGFTDNTGTAPYNLELSQRRANAVMLALQDMGIASNRVAIRGYGKELPVSANDSAAGRQMNRRVEIVLSDDTGVVKLR